MATRKENFSTGLLYKLPPEINKVYIRLCNLISNERTLRNQEYLLVGTLAQELYKQHKALESILNDGAILHSQNRDGPITKTNPWVDVHQKSNIQIIRLSEKLGLSKIDFMKMEGTEEGDYEDDPIANFLKKRKHKGE